MATSVQDSLAQPSPIGEGSSKESKPKLWGRFEFLGVTRDEAAALLAEGAKIPGIVLGPLKSGDHPSYNDKQRKEKDVYLNSLAEAYAIIYGKIKEDFLHLVRSDPDFEEIDHGNDAVKLLSLIYKVVQKPHAGQPKEVIEMEKKLLSMKQEPHETATAYCLRFVKARKIAENFNPLRKVEEAANLYAVMDQHALIEGLDRDRNRSFFQRNEDLVAHMTNELPFSTFEKLHEEIVERDEKSVSANHANHAALIARTNNKNPNTNNKRIHDSGKNTGQGFGNRNKRARGGRSKGKQTPSKDDLKEPCKYCERVPELKSKSDTHSIDKCYHLEKLIKTEKEKKSSERTNNTKKSAFGALMKDAAAQARRSQVLAESDAESL